MTPLNGGAVTWRLRSAAYQHAVPVDLQIGCNADFLRALREFACEIGSHGTRAAGRESHIVYHSLPVSIGALRFDVGCDRLNSRLGRGVNAIRRKVSNLAGARRP